MLSGKDERDWDGSWQWPPMVHADRANKEEDESIRFDQCHITSVTIWFVSHWVALRAVFAILQKRFYQTLSILTTYIPNQWMLSVNVWICLMCYLLPITLWNGRANSWQDTLIARTHCAVCSVALQRKIWVIWRCGDIQLYSLWHFLIFFFSYV